jgi:hypothetical protein
MLTAGKMDINMPDPAARKPALRRFRSSRCSPWSAQRLPACTCLLPERWQELWE